MQKCLSLFLRRPQGCSVAFARWSVLAAQSFVVQRSFILQRSHDSFTEKVGCKMLKKSTSPETKDSAFTWTLKLSSTLVYGASTTWMRTARMSNPSHADMYATMLVRLPPYIPRLSLASSQVTGHYAWMFFSHIPYPSMDLIKSSYDPGPGPVLVCTTTTIMHAVALFRENTSIYLRLNHQRFFIFMQREFATLYTL